MEYKVGDTSIEDRLKELRKMCIISLNDSNYSDKIEVLINDYEYVEEDGKVYFVKKKKEVTYPKTYEKCAEIIAELTGSDCNPKGCMGYMSVQLTALQKLLICRDAYWKIAGEEMGLGKPWKPQDTNTFSIFYDRLTGEIEKQDGYCGANSTLEFPTAEMRDAFSEAFKKDIEYCKELL